MRIQFSLRALMLFTALCAITVAWFIADRKSKSREREVILEYFRRDNTADIMIRNGNIVKLATGGPDNPVEAFSLLGRLDFIEELSVRRAPDNCLMQLKGRRRLKRLAIDDPTLSDDGVAALAHLTGLRSLTLYSPRLSDDVFRDIEKMDQLEELNLHSINITGHGLAYLKHLRKLRRVSLTGTEIDDAALRHLAKISQLETLRIADTKVMGSGLRYLAGIPTLREIDVSDNPIDSLDGLSNVPNLETIVARNTRMSGCSISSLSQLTKLRTLDLGDTPMDSTWIEIFQRSRPEVRISCALRVDDAVLTDEQARELFECPSK